MVQLIQQFNKNGLRILFANVYTRRKLSTDRRTNMFLDEPTEEVAGEATTPADDTAAEETHTEVEAPADAEVAA